MDSAAKLSKSFEKVIIEVLLLYMVIPGRINFTQLGKYGRHGEQCYRQNFGRLRSKSLNWLRFNASLALRRSNGLWVEAFFHASSSLSISLSIYIRVLLYCGCKVTYFQSFPQLFTIKKRNVKSQRNSDIKITSTGNHRDRYIGTKNFPTNSHLYCLSPSSPIKWEVSHGTFSPARAT